MRKAILALAALALATVAQADQKNVQILTNLTDQQLGHVMQLMRSSLGVGCDFCHAAGADNRLDFASDKKDEKRTAREMIAMVQKLNKEQFGGHTVISCNTCHAGKPAPEALISLPMQPPPREMHEPRPQMPPLDEVVKKYADAVGDFAKWQHIVAKGTREGMMNKNTPIAFEMVDGKAKVESEVPSDQATAAYAEPTPPSAIPKEARVIHETKVDGRDAYLVVRRLPDGARERLYFDTKSGLLMRRMIISDSPVGPMPQQTDFEDWRDIGGGVKYPFVVKVSLVDPRATAVRRYADVKVK